MTPKPSVLRSILLVVCLLPCLARAETTCIGPLDARKFVVYLHGTDTEPPGSQELGYRKTLATLGSNLKVRFALPRASKSCPFDNKVFCWTWEPKTKDDLRPIMDAVHAAALACFPAKRKYSVVGFSNGGMAVNAISRLCLPNSFEALVSIGAGGPWYPSDPPSLKDCRPKLFALLGSGDLKSQQGARGFVAHLKTLNAPVELVEYEGDHVVLYEPLAKVLDR